MCSVRRQSFDVMVGVCRHHKAATVIQALHRGWSCRRALAAANHTAAPVARHVAVLQGRGAAVAKSKNKKRKTQSIQIQKLTPLLIGQSEKIYFYEKVF